MEYQILEFESYFELTLSVIELIGEGWTPQGGVSTCALDLSSGIFRRYCQAMIRINK